MTGDINYAPVISFRTGTDIYLMAVSIIHIKGDIILAITPGNTNITIRNMTPIMFSYCINAKYLFCGSIPDKILEPSRGGIGNMLNTARLIFII